MKAVKSSKYRIYRLLVLLQESWSKRLRCDVCDYIQSLRDLCDESILVKIVLVHCGVAAQHQSQDWAHSPTQLNILK